MNNKVLSCLIAGALGTTLALASPALAHGGGGGPVVAGTPAMSGGGGAHGGMSGGTHFGAMGGMHFGAMSGGRFGGMHFAHAGFHGGFRHRVFHHRFHRFVFVGAPFLYAGYDSCWRRVWTDFGLQWVNVCNDYGY